MKQLKYKFHRQYGIGKYIVDLYCPKKKLVIEVDGSTHETEEEIKHDREREEYFKNLGLTIKRYTNNEVFENIDTVVTDIYEALNGPLE